ncbi:MAG: 50S ribosomal protein L22 [Nitrospirae bacterium]|nr:50S ribosomal protein L22 [Nitrospirota bacterium]
MAGNAVLRFAKLKPRKARDVVDLIRGKKVDEAEAILRGVRRKASEPILKLLKAAIASAESHTEMDLEKLVVKRAYVDEGPTMKRFRPMPFGRAGRVRKRTCHITIELGEGR